MSMMVLGLLLAIGPFVLLVSLLLLWKRWYNRGGRRDPINFKRMRTAGDGVRESLASERESFDATATFAIFLGPLCVAFWALHWMSRHGFTWQAFEPTFIDWFLLAMAVVGYVSCFFQLKNHATRGWRFRQALAAELAVGQCLNQVMAEGGLAFHDFPGERFNIDHIVIGHSAVFAIETKSRRKPARGGKEAARVLYDGARLVFPDHTETKPLEQSKAQADWLRKFLASGVGEPVRVIPYVALPGWYVETKVPKPDVLVGNPRNVMFMMRAGFGPPIGEVMKRRIAHVLAERYPMDEFEAIEKRR
jgi:hypothetical protein